MWKESQVVHKAGTTRVLENVAGYVLESFFPAHNVVIVSLLPQLPASLGLVSEARQLLEALHEIDEVALIRAFKQKVKVVGHEAIREDGHRIGGTCVVQAVKAEPNVWFADERLMAIHSRHSYREREWPGVDASGEVNSLTV